MTQRPSLSGRLAHWGQKYLGRPGNALVRMQARQFERSGGKRGGKLRGKPTFRLIVRGRTSGELRSVMLMLVRHGDDLLVCGSWAGADDHPNWWKNLVAAGEAEVQVGDESWPVRARQVTEPTERAEAWTLLCAAYPDFASYQQLTDRTLPIAALERAG